MFSLNLGSADKGPLIPSKAKNMHQRRTFFRGQGGSGVQDMTPPLLGNLGANKFSERHSLISSPILCNSAVVIFTQQFKTIDSNNFTLSSFSSGITKIFFVGIINGTKHA